MPAGSVWVINGVCARCAQPLYGEPAGGAGLAGVEENRVDTVQGWFDAFNGRDLDGMLVRMHPRVDFHPLRLQGVESAYVGHDGVRRWFSRLQAMEHDHRVELASVRAGRDGQLIAIGSIRLSTGTPEDDSFWALERFAEGLIVAAYHYLTDPSIGEDGLLSF
jgi:ketosteroid isomerase-like protein